MSNNYKQDTINRACKHLQLKKAGIVVLYIGKRSDVSQYGVECRHRVGY